jgi:predicted NBD/HSP70 family sugar kinase
MSEPLHMGNLSAFTCATSAVLGQYKQKAGISEEIDGIQFFDLVKKGDPVANEVFQDFCQFTARYFYNLQTVLDVDRIAVGGGISAEPMVVEGIREAVHQVFDYEKFPLPQIEPEIVKCRYGNDANLIGAVRNFLDTKVLR